MFFPQECPEKHESVCSGWETRCVFPGWGVKASVSKTGFHEGILVPPSRAAVGSSRMWPFLSAVLTSAAATPPPSVPLSPSHLHPWDFAPSLSIHFAPSHPLWPTASFLPCSCLPIPVSDFSVILVLLCLSRSPSASPVLVPQPQDPAAAALLSAPRLLHWLYARSQLSAGALCPAKCVRSTQYKQGFLCLQTAVSCSCQAKIALDMTVVCIGRGTVSGKALASVHPRLGNWERFFGKRVLCVDRRILKKGSSLLPKHGQQEPSSRLLSWGEHMPFRVRQNTLKWQQASLALF